jgi:WD40 repeat protein
VAWNGEARLVDLTQPAAPPRSLPKHGGRLLAVAFSPDSRWVATAGEDSLIRVSDLTQPKQPPLVLRGHTSKINDYALVFSPDSHWLVSGSQDNTARLWRVGIDDLIQQACQAAGRNLTPEEWLQDLGGQAPRSTCPNLTLGEAPLVPPGP